MQSDAETCADPPAGRIRGLQPRRLPRGLLPVLLGGVLVGCVTIPRAAAPPTVIADVAPPGFGPTVRFLGNDRDAFVANAEKTLRRVRDAADGGPINILALSGGGAGGSFAAGALVGMSRRGDRPEFQIVTGVSAGALIAPFAFLGPRWDGELEKTFNGLQSDHFLRPRGIAFLFRPGFYDQRPLADLIDHIASRKLLTEVGRERAKGRLLLVATTDLDKQETVIWDMGAIALGEGEKARALFRDVLMASASIPGVLPPVLIHVEGGGRSYDEMHVDGGTTMPFFIASEIAQLAPQTLEPLKGARVLVLVNGQLSSYPRTTPERPVAVLSRTFSAALMHASRTALEASLAFAERYSMSFRYSFIPVTHAYGGALRFKSAEMHALFDYGARCAEKGALWTTVAQAIEEGQPAAQALPHFDDSCTLGAAQPWGRLKKGPEGDSSLPV